MQGESSTQGAPIPTFPRKRGKEQGTPPSLGKSRAVAASMG
jgi:hypothetical protein